MSEQKMPSKWKVERGSLITESGATMKSSCKHRKDWSACGGCYSRLYVALTLISSGKVKDPVAFVKELFDAMKAETKER